MGMPVNNENLISITQKPNADSRRAAVNGLIKQRNGTSFSPMLVPSPPNASDKMLDRKHSASDLLPPIGIKLSKSTYSSPTSRRQYDSPLEIGVDGSAKRHHRSPLSPTSTLSSQDGSNKSTRLSPAGGLLRSKTWTGDLNSSQHGSGKLETLYEAAVVTTTHTLDQLSIIQEAKPEASNSRTLPSVISSSQPVDHRHMNIRSTQTTLISPTPPTVDKNNNSQNPSTTSTSVRHLTANRLSQENLEKHRHTSQSSSMSSTVAQVKASSDTGYDTDDEKESRIVEWLIGVEESQTEQPPEAGGIPTNEKRDTAIHIVYEGD